METAIPHKILNYFKELLKANIIKSLRDQAVNKVAIENGPFTEFVDKENGIVIHTQLFWDEASDDSIEGTVTYDFYKEHKFELLQKSELVIQAIDILVYQKCEDDTPYKPLLQIISKDLSDLLARAKRLYPAYPEIATALLKIEEHLYSKYQIKPRPTKTVDEKLSVFGFKDTLSREIFQDIYELVDTLGIIEFDIVDEHTFLEIFLENSNDPKSVIHFNCNNGVAITLLERLRPYFSSLTPKAIEESRKFLTKQGSVLTESNYNASNNRIKRNPTEDVTILNKKLDAILK